MNTSNYCLNKNLRLHHSNLYDSMPLMETGDPMIAEFLSSLHGVILKALNDYRRVFSFRFDLHLPANVDASAGVAENAVVSRFMQSLKAKIRHNRARVASTGALTHNTKVRYFWVREVGEGGRVHYHFAIFLNGNAFNWLGNFQSNRSNMANRIWEAWASALGETVERAKTLVHFPENPSYMLLRGNHETVAAFFHRASYLCKARTKQYGYGHHGYGASRT